jgi:hypothetical protein
MVPEFDPGYAHWRRPEQEEAPGTGRDGRVALSSEFDSSYTQGSQLEHEARGTGRNGRVE